MQANDSSDSQIVYPQLESVCQSIMSELQSDLKLHDEGVFPTPIQLPQITAAEYCKVPHVVTAVQRFVPAYQCQQGSAPDDGTHGTHVKTCCLHLEPLLSDSFPKSKIFSWSADRPAVLTCCVSCSFCLPSCQGTCSKPHPQSPPQQPSTSCWVWATLRCGS